MRFSGCNLWSGLEKDREKAICQFCDTNFWGTDGENGGKYDIDSLISKLDTLWLADNHDNKFIVCTGGEPALQLDTNLVEALHQSGYEIAIETNGTVALPKEIDWICVSPKANTKLLVTSGDELKLVVPQAGQSPEDFSELDFKHYYLQAMDSKDLADNILLAIDYCKQYPKWKLSVQTHKYLGIK